MFSGSGEIRKLWGEYCKKVDELKNEYLNSTVEKIKEWEPTYKKLYFCSSYCGEDPERSGRNKEWFLVTRNYLKIPDFSGMCHDEYGQDPINDKFKEWVDDLIRRDEMIIVSENVYRRL